MNIDPDAIFQQDAIEMVRSDALREQRWLVQLQKEQKAGYERTDYIAKQQMIVRSLSEMADYAAERRMLATVRWVYNEAAAASVANKLEHPWAGLPDDRASAVRAAVEAGTVLKEERRDAKYGVSTDLKLVEFTDPELGQRWAVLAILGKRERYLTDHPTEFDAITRFQGLMTATDALQ